MTPALSLNRREGQQARVHFYDYSILHFFLGEKPCNLFNRIYDAFSHMSFISSCSCDPLYSILCFYLACMLRHHTHSYRCTESHIDFLQTSFRFIVSFILRFIVSHLSRLLKLISHFCHNFSHLFFVMCFTSYLGFYFHVFTFMSSKLHCYFSDYNRSLIQLSYSTSYTSLMCLFLFMRQILCNKLSFNIYLTSFNNSNQHLFTDTLLASFDSSYCNLFTFYFCNLSNL